METITCNFIEAKSLRKKLRSQEKELGAMLLAVRRGIRIVSGVINENEVGEQSWLVQLPLEVLIRDNGSGPKRKSINWKKVVLDAIVEYDMPVSSELLYNKLVLKNAYIPLDRRFVLKNISAALHYLEAKDQKLFRIKEEGRRGYVYGLKHFFDFNLQLKPVYRKRYRMEAVGDEVETV